jgi:hypothetical protein
MRPVATGGNERHFVAVGTYCNNLVLIATNLFVAIDRNPCSVMTHKYRGCIIVLSINKSVEPNEEQKVLTSGFDQGFTINTSKRVFRGI